MNLLDVDQLFYTCPYPVKYDGDEYTFRTDHDIVYAVAAGSTRWSKRFLFIRAFHSAERNALSLRAEVTKNSTFACLFAIIPGVMFEDYPRLCNWSSLHCIWLVVL